MKRMRGVGAVLLVVIVMVGGAFLLRRSLAVTAADGPVAQASWPPAHMNLSGRTSLLDSSDADIEAVQVDGGDRVLVAVWTDGKSAAESAGSIRIKWKFESDDYWRRPSVQLPEWSSTYVYKYPALALHKSGSSVIAHVVWYHQNTSTSQNDVYYTTCTLSASGGTCEGGSQVSPSTTQAISAPDIALDEAGYPHIVWSQDTYIFYRYKLPPSAGANPVWGVPLQVEGRYQLSGGGFFGGDETSFPARGKGPVIAVRGYWQDEENPGKVYVAWDRDCDVEGDKPSSAGCGIWFAVRDTAGLFAGTELEEIYRWRFNDISTIGTDLGSDEKNSLYDERPAIAVGDNHVYVAWQRLETIKPEFGGINCYEHAVAYRVFHGSNVAADWWLGGDDDTQLAYVNRPADAYRSYTVQTEDEFYGGVRPAIDVVGDVLHMAWQYESTETCDGGGGGGGGQSILPEAGVHASGEDFFDTYVYTVTYAYADHATLGGEISWEATTPMTSPLRIDIQQIRADEQFFTNPDLAILPDQTVPHPHVVLLNRFATGNDYGFHIWYANDKVFLSGGQDEPGPVYLPVIIRNYPK